MLKMLRQLRGDSADAARVRAEAYDEIREIDSFFTDGSAKHSLSSDTSVHSLSSDTSVTTTLKNITSGDILAQIVDDMVSAVANEKAYDVGSSCTNIPGTGWFFIKAKGNHVNLRLEAFPYATPKKTYSISRVSGEWDNDGTNPQWTQETDQYGRSNKDTTVQIGSGVDTLSVIMANINVRNFFSAPGAICTPEGTGAAVAYYTYEVAWANQSSKTCHVVAKKTGSLANYEIWLNNGTWGEWQMISAGGTFAGRLIHEVSKAIISSETYRFIRVKSGEFTTSSSETAKTITYSAAFATVGLVAFVRNKATGATYVGTSSAAAMVVGGIVASANYDWIAFGY